MLEHSTSRMTWIGRVDLEPEPGFIAEPKPKEPIDEAMEPAFSLETWFKNKQPEVDWRPHSKRLYDRFGRLWKPDRREGEGQY